MSNKVLERLEAEEKEAEKLMYESDEEDAETETEQGRKPDSEPNFESDEPGEDSTDEREERSSWKKRYTSYKASTDHTIHQLRLKVAALEGKLEEYREEISNLTNQLSQVHIEREEKKDPLEGIMTTEEEELLGPEATAVLKKFATKLSQNKNTSEDVRVKLLEKRLAELQKQEAERREALSKSQQNEDLMRFKGRLKAFVENFGVLDEDPKFGEYLQEVDEYSGLTRVHHFKNAINSRDVAGVARFYNDFRATRPKTREERLEEEVTPEGRGAETARTEDGKFAKKRFHVSEYENFMNEVTKGLYRGREKEAKKLEMMYDRAFVEGRVDF